jgi:hypothetical protein
MQVSRFEDKERNRYLPSLTLLNFSSFSLFFLAHSSLSSFYARL